MNKYRLNIVATLVYLLPLVMLSCSQVNTPTTPTDVIGSGEVKDELEHAEWTKNATIYEVNVRQHTPEGTFKAFTKDLERLKDLGVDILWLMPIHPIGDLNRKGGENKNNFIVEPGSLSLGSPYSVKNYKAVNPDMGTLEDFKQLVLKAHSLNMRVILDWVANHSAFDCVWTETNRGYYLLDKTGNLQPPTGTDWWDVSQLDWINGEENGLYNGMASAMEFWVLDTDIDGFRCDVAEKVPVAFWEMARRRLESIKPEIFMLAEAEVPAHHRRAFDMSYGWHFHHLTNQIAKGAEDASILRTYIEEESNKFNLDDYRMGFATNHDENSWNGTVYERYGDGADAMVVLAATLLDMPLIYSGQEAGMNKRLRFFEKDTIEWGTYSKTDLFRKLNTLHHEEKALWNGDWGGTVELLASNDNSKVFAFSKKKDESQVIVILNLNNETVVPGVDLSQGKFKEVLSKGLLENDSIAGWGYKVLVAEK